MNAPKLAPSRARAEHSRLNTGLALKTSAKSKPEAKLDLLYLSKSFKIAESFGSYTSKVNSEIAISHF